MFCEHDKHVTTHVLMTTSGVQTSGCCCNCFDAFLKSWERNRIMRSMRQDVDVDVFVDAVVEERT
jgi:hypothetical protein